MASINHKEEKKASVVQYTFCCSSLAACVRQSQRSFVSALLKLYFFKYFCNPLKKTSVPRTFSNILIMDAPFKAKHSTINVFFFSFVLMAQKLKKVKDKP